MSTNKLPKILHYFRSWQDNQVINLENIVSQMLSLAPLANDTQIIDNEITKRIQHRDGPEGSKGLFLYLSYAPKDEHMRTMNNIADSKNDKGGTSAPPGGQTFVTKEAFLHIRQHDLLFCGNGMRIENVETYFNSLNNKLRSNNEELPYLNLSLRPVVNCDKLKLINQHGVRYIAINASAYELSLRDINKNTGRQSWIQKGINRIGEIMSKDIAEEDCNAKEELQVNISLKLNGNTRASAVAHETILKEAQDIIESSSTRDSHDFEIITQKGEVIKSSEVKISKQHVRIQRLGQSNGLLPYDAYQKLQEYYLELEQLNLTQS